MKQITIDDIRDLFLPPDNSHKGQNGRLLVIGGSHFFHAASLWALTVSSRLVDLVHYASVPENNTLVMQAKEEFRNGIVVPREDIERYIEEDDVILIGPGMVRSENPKSNIQYPNVQEILSIEDEGEQTEALTNYLLKKYPHKKWVIDAGALQMVDISRIPQHAIVTPHIGEFESLWEYFHVVSGTAIGEVSLEQKVLNVATQLGCVVLLKGKSDIVASPGNVFEVQGGNSGMTKGGTGDVLAGLVAGLACKNDVLLAACAGSFINKQAGDDLYEMVGPFFNASDLASQIPKTMKRLLSL